MENEGATPRLSDVVEGESVEYRAISSLAIVALLLGLASALAFVGPLFWIIPVLGALTSVLALRQIEAAGPEMTGRTLALAGLGLSILFGVAAPANLLSTNWWLGRDARPTAEQWFEYLQRGEPHKALQLQRPPSVRRPLDERLWDYYTNQREAYEELQQFVNGRLVRTLLALGSGAEIRFYETAEVNAARDEVRQTYAVTYDDRGEKKTFFVQILLERSAVRSAGHLPWQVMNYRGGIRPGSLVE